MKPGASGRRFSLGLAGATLLGRTVQAQANNTCIGAPLPLTGPLAPEVVKPWNGYDLWAAVVA